MLKITFFARKQNLLINPNFLAQKMQNKAIFAKIATLSVARATKVARPPSHRECANSQTKRRTRNERGVIVNREFGIESYSSSGSATKIRPQYSQTIIFLPRRTSAWRWGGIRL